MNFRYLYCKFLDNNLNKMHDRICKYKEMIERREEQLKAQIKKLPDKEFKKFVERNCDKND